MASLRLRAGAVLHNAEEVTAAGFDLSVPVKFEP